MGEGGLVPDTFTPPTSYLSLLHALIEKGEFAASPLADRIVAYSGELANLRIDFERMKELHVGWWDMVHGFEEPDSARGLMRKKFLVTYTEDNAVIRIHAYRERVFQLTNAVLALGIPERNLKEKLSFTTLVTQALRERGQVALLRHLESFTVEKPPAIKDSLERRNEFIHRIPTREWETLTSWAQLHDWLDYDRDKESFQTKEPTDVQLEADNLKRRWKWVDGFLDSLIEELDIFEESFCRLLFEASLGGHVG